MLIDIEIGKDFFASMNVCVRGFWTFVTLKKIIIYYTFIQIFIAKIFIRKPQVITTG